MSLRSRTQVTLAGLAGVAVLIGVAPAADAAVASPVSAASSSTSTSPSMTAFAASPSPSPATPTATIVLTNADDGRTLTLAAGTEVEIDLTPPRSGDVWSPVGDQRRNPVHDVTTDANGLTQHIRVNATDSLVSKTDTACAHDATPCSITPQSWRVDVTVPSGPVPDNPAEAACSGTAPTSSPGTRVVTASDSGRGVTVHQGDTVLAASRCAGGDPVTAAGAGTQLFRTRIAGSGGMHSVDTSFIAASTGRTDLQWQTIAQCQPSQGQIYCYGRPDLLLRVTVTVVPANQPIDPADDQCVQSLNPANFAYASLPGNTVHLAGQADPGATVRIYFRRYDQTSFILRRTLVADSAGHVSTTYVADAPYRFYAAAGTVCQTREDHSDLKPGITGPATVRRGSTITLRVVGQPGSTIQVLFRRRGQTQFALRRTGILDATGRYSTTYRADADYRYQVHDQTQYLDGNVGLTQVR